MGEAGTQYGGKENMENCPLCGEKLVIIAGYTMPNFCRHCDKLIITSEMEETW